MDDDDVEDPTILEVGLSILDVHRSRSVKEERPVDESEGDGVFLICTLLTISSGVVLSEAPS